jgi:hypothetical protein
VHVLANIIKDVSAPESSANRGTFVADNGVLVFNEDRETVIRDNGPTVPIDWADLSFPPLPVVLPATPPPVPSVSNYLQLMNPVINDTNT